MSAANLLVLFSIVPRSTYSGRQLLVGYWGQNGAGPAHGPANYEKPLVEVCRTTKYDILAVSFVTVFFSQRNKGNDALTLLKVLRHLQVILKKNFVAIAYFSKIVCG